MPAASLFERNAFVQESLPALSRLAYVLTLDPELTQDLVQETALRIHIKWKSVAASTHPHAYVRKMLVNEFFAMGRAKTREKLALRLEQDPLGGHHEGVADQVERRQLVADMLSELPGRQRVAIALKYLEDRPDPEIAEILGVRDSTVRSLVKRGLDSIRSNHSYLEGVQA